MSNHPKRLVINNNYLNWQLLTRNKLQFLQIHLETAISINRNNRFSASIMCTNRRR